VTQAARPARGILRAVYHLRMISLPARFLATATLLGLLACGVMAQSKPYPKPQEASAQGQSAPDFTLQDQNGKDFRLSDQRGHWVLLFFYRGYWCPYCMAELRELTRRSDQLEALHVQLVPISVDDQEHAHDVWEKIANGKFPILSDPGAAVIAKYGLLHEAGHEGNNIALRTTLLVGPDGRERWRRVSQSVPDIPTADETLAQIKRAQEQKTGAE
jgi:thioredoxin-dependent peroxiredoxin